MPLTRVTFEIEGPPRGKQRPTFGQGFAYTPKETVAEENFIREKLRKAMDGRPPIVGPVKVEFSAIYEMPSSWSARLQSMSNVPHLGKPDIDNVEKLLLDACNGLAWRDDAQVCEVHKRKFYGLAARLEVRIEELATTVDHPAVKRATKREEEDRVTPRTARRKKPRQRVAARAVKETPIGKRIK